VQKRLTGLQPSHFPNALCQGGVEVEERLESYVRHMTIIHRVMQLVTAKGFGIVHLEQYIAAPRGSISLDVTDAGFRTTPIAGSRDGDVIHGLEAEWAEGLSPWRLAAAGRPPIWPRRRRQ